MTGVSIPGSSPGGAVGCDKKKSMTGWWLKNMLKNQEWDDWDLIML